MSSEFVPQLLSRRAAAAVLGISTQTLIAWGKAGRGPRPLRLTAGCRGRVIFRRQDVEAFANDPEQPTAWPVRRFDPPAMQRKAATP